MKIKNEPLLASFRCPGLCEVCGRPCSVREPHHIFARGMGGGGQLDIPINLCAVGQAFQCSCHRRHHDGNLPRSVFIEAVAVREGMPVCTIDDTLKRLSSRITDTQCECKERVQVGRDAFVCFGCGRDW